MISEAYREEQKVLHENPDYGRMSVEYAPFVSRIINNLNLTDILDYGAGKGRLAEYLTVDHTVSVCMYEPAIDKWSMTPEPHEFVACIDVLEHIEPEFINDVLDDLKRVTKRVGFFTIATVKAKKILSDGRNAHLIQKPIEWWMPKIIERFKLVSMDSNSSGFYVIVNSSET